MAGLMDGRLLAEIGVVAFLLLLMWTRGRRPTDAPTDDETFDWPPKP